MAPDERSYSHSLIRFEPFLLFLAFYFPGYLLQTEHLSGRLFNSVAFNLTYIAAVLPRMALLLYILLLRSRLSHPEAPIAASLSRYGLKPLRSADIGWIFVALVSIEVVIVPLSLLASLLSHHTHALLAGGQRWRIANPALLPLVFITCMSVGYSEELYFRSYLLTALPSLGIRLGPAILASTALFGLGHLYEGLIGLVGALAIGAILSFFFLRRRNLHVIAVAHGLYNFLALAATLVQPGFYL